MKWTRRTASAAGLVLILATNVVALAGAVCNRGGEPDSTLDLTQRELRLPGMWTGRRENSGLALRLRWRVLPAEVLHADFYRFGGESAGAPAWLDSSKMASLGFDTKPSAGGASLDRTPERRTQLPRDVFIVLELDGSAYRQALDRAVKAAKEVEAMNARGEGTKDAQAIIERETHQNSRLFAVDAALDPEALRARYPDRTRFAIVRGQVRPAWSPAAAPSGGMIERVNAESLNVPLELRTVFAGVEPVLDGGTSRHAGRFDARVAFGRRLEPWLVSAVRR